MKQGNTRFPVASSTFDDYFFLALGVLLAGYAIGSKLFAYISIPPLYIGDIVLVFGIIAFLKSRCAAAALATLPSLLMAVLFGWAIFVCALPHLREYGIDTLRDSVTVAYGVFAFIIVALLLERPERLALVIPFLRIVGSVVILVTPILVVLLITIGEGGFLSPYIQLGTYATHLLGAALLMFLGFKRAGIGWLIILSIGIALLAMRSRGSLLAFAVPLAVAVIVTGRWREATLIVVSAAGLIGLAYMLDLSVQTPDVLANREISARQLVGNFLSIFGAPTNVQGGLEGTRTWRLEWWKVIYDYTFSGPYFWTGKGFGINLAAVDGFLLGDPNMPVMRSPHNSHLTVLARTGVPGLALWLLTLASWSAMLSVNMVRARLAGDKVWADFFLLIFCYAIAFIIEATFAVALEGPVSGIWFWSLFGIGIGATMIYRASLEDIEKRAGWQATPQALGAPNV
jgi:O-Antigen ligase